MALATPSEPGLLLEVGTIGSPGWVTSDSWAWTDMLSETASTAVKQQKGNNGVLRITLAELFVYLITVERR
jgi:hypothetical protein